VLKDPSIASKNIGPQDYRLSNFGCSDGDTALHLQGVFQELSEDSLVVSDIRGLQF
jgi:hypothetical protein